MELREYLRILAQRIWLILSLTFLALVTSLWFSYQQTPIYEAKSSYVAKLGLSLLDAPSDTLIYGIDTLAGRQRIFVTYCEVVTSRTVRDEAYSLLSIDPVAAKLDDYKVSCANLVETNVLSISVQGPSQQVALQLNEAIGTVGSIKANTLYSSFPLEKLDNPKIEEDIVSPNITRNGVLGGLLGLVIGITLSLMIEYLRTPLERLEASSIRNMQVGTYNERYFRQRFQQELNRPYARLRPMSMGLVQITPNEGFERLPEMIQNALLRNVALTIQDMLKQRTDIIGYLRKWTFGILLTETPGEEARAILQKVHNEIRSKTFETSGYVATFTANTGIMAGSGNLVDYQTVLSLASDALGAAEAEGENIIRVITTTPKPFLTGQSDEDVMSAPANGSVFNVSESDLFGSDAVDDNISWPAPRANQTPDFNTVPEATNTADTESPQRRHRLVRRGGIPSELRPDAESEQPEAPDDNTRAE